MPLITMVLLLMLVGCAAPSWEKTIPPANPAYSKAMNIFIASGEIDGPTQYVRDFSVDQLEQLGVNRVVSGSNLAVSAGYAATHAINPPINVSTGTAATMGAGFLVLDFLESAVYKPGTRDTAWVWVPFSLSNDPLNAHHKAIEIIKQAWAESIGLGGQITPLETGITQQNIDRTFQVRKPGCPLDSCVLTVGAWPNDIASIQKLRAQPAPSFLTSIGTVYSPIQIGARMKPGSPLSWQSLTFDQFRSFSTALPEWAVIYLAPKKGRNAIPVMLQKGEVLYFAQPG